MVGSIRLEGGLSLLLLRGRSARGKHLQESQISHHHSPANPNKTNNEAISLLLADFDATKEFSQTTAIGKYRSTGQQQKVQNTKNRYSR